ncbi:MAG TPA: response regulator [Streptosporangiaceae bacterium]|nr:response regulator [Streptosporangiaceae bacterium]
MSDYQPRPDGRILLVEDDPDSARFIEHVLGGRAGFEIEHAPSPAAALPRIGPERWDLIITDIEMPEMTGIEMLETLRRQAPSVPVVVISAHATVDNTLGALRGRADDFLQKPLRPDPLIATVSNIIARGRGGREVVLAVGAHPDDVEIGAAGALLAHRAAGHEIAILTMSHGARSGPDEARAGESRRAAAILGASLYLEDLDDTRISESDPTISAISAVIEAAQPTIIYTHSIHDVHQDHRNTHRAVMVAAREVGSVFCYQSPSATVDFRPGRFIAIDEHMTVKLAAIGAFGSQAAARQYLAADLIEATARYWSRFGTGRFAEAFEVVRDHAASPLPGTPGLTAAVSPREAARTQQALQEAALRKAADQEAAVLAAAVAENAPDEQAAQQALAEQESEAEQHLREAGHVTS